MHESRRLRIMLVPSAPPAQAPADALADDPWATVWPEGTTRPGDPDDAGRWRGGPAADGARAAAQAEANAEPVAGPPALARGGCCAWPLPADATCAAVARDVFRQAASVLGLPAELEFDGMTMASELAANTLHAHGSVEFGAAGAWPLAGAPELWIYLRPAVGHWELVCKVFDSLCGWKNGAAPVPGNAELDSVSGRGLQVVAGRSVGPPPDPVPVRRLEAARKGGVVRPAGPGQLRPRPAAAVPVRGGTDRPGPGGDAHRARAGRGPPPSPGAGRRDVGALRPVRADRVVPPLRDLVADPGRRQRAAGAQRSGGHRRAARVPVRRDGRRIRLLAPGPGPGAVIKRGPRDSGWGSGIRHIGPAGPLSPGAPAVSCPGTWAVPCG